MKKIIALILVIFLLAGCSGQRYEKAIAELENQSVVSGVNDDDAYKNILTAIKSAEFKAPKNIILMIGDGMGFNACTYTEAIKRDSLYKGKLMMTRLPNQGKSGTNTIDGGTTDSAAGGTALATGYKTRSSIVAISPDLDTEYQTVLELAASLGKSTGIVTTTELSDATPASFTAHVIIRTQREEITVQQLKKLTDGSLDLMIGPGSQYLSNQMVATAKADAEKAGVTITKDWNSAKSAELPLAGYIKDSGDIDIGGPYPPLSETTKFAIDKLSADKNGFFLMVEGSCIDHASHENNLSRMTNELYDFDKAVAVAMRFVALNPDTILIVTADHETGGLWLPEDFSYKNLEGASYSTSDHTNRDVPVYAVGYGTEKLARYNKNNEIGIFIANSMGVKSFGDNGILEVIK